MRKLLSLTILLSGLEWNKYLMLSKKKSRLSSSMRLAAFSLLSAFISSYSLACVELHIFTFKYLEFIVLLYCLLSQLEKGGKEYKYFEIFYS